MPFKRPPRNQIKTRPRLFWSNNIRGTLGILDTIIVLYDNHWPRVGPCLNPELPALKLQIAPTFPTPPTVE